MREIYLEAYLGIEDIGKILSNAVKAVSNKRTLDKVGEDLVERIKTRTRLGKGVKKPEGVAHQLPTLQPKTKRNRKSLKRSGKLTGPGATPAKSGINRTGETLESLDHEVGNKEIKIRLNSRGERVASELINQDRDFTFMNVSKPELNSIVETLDKEIQKKIK